ncbi:MAG: 16S rRNA (uracil(1498)-N(3))-methyltransferase [Bdellovibrionales bacterium]|nr:16S rRNA (uracil(1498)-N(3))-methyltransferase [Bdellovibrionales bacterium]
MRRIWVDPSNIQEPQFELIDESFKHAIQVSRFRVGEPFEVVSGQDFALEVKLIEIKKKSATVEVVGRRALPPIAMPYIRLAFAVSKWSTFENVLEKSVELGVSSIQPLITDFSFIRAKKDWPDSRTDRFQKIIRGATEQCGRGRLMELRNPLTLQEFITDLNPSDSTVGLFAYEGPSVLDIRAQLSLLNKPGLKEIWAIVGSEGGFSEDEVSQIKSIGLPPVTMGAQILRAETACLAMVSVIKYELGLMR